MYGRFKGFLLGTGLHHRFNVMSHIGMFSEGMHAFKAECGTLHSPAPIPFIPHGGKTDIYEAQTIKVQISDTVSEKFHLFTGGEPKKYLQFFDTVSGFVRKKNIKTDTNELELAIKEEQLEQNTHLMLGPIGDIALEYATDSGAEDEEDGEEEGLDGEEGNSPNDGRPLCKSANRHRKVKAKQEHMQKETEKLSKGAKSDTSKKTKRPKLTRCQKWQVTKFGHE